MKKITALAALLAIPALAAPAGYFQVPGTDTTLKISGRVELREAYGLNCDGMSDATSGLPMADVAANPAKYKLLGDNSASRMSDDTRQSGQWSGDWRYYLGFTTTTPSAFGDIVTVINGRFKHTSGVINGQSVNFNMEQGYVKIGGLKIGSDGSLFGYGAWEPNSLFGMVADEDGSWGRVRQIQYIASPVQGLDLGVALEAHTSSNSAGDSNGTTPNLSAVAAYSADWGGVTFGINYQQKKDWVKTGSAPSGTGTSFILSGGWNITKNDQLTAMILKGGEGVGSSNDGFYTEGSDYSFYKSTAYSVSFTHTWNDQFSSAIALGLTKWPKDVTAQGDLGYSVADDFKVNEYVLNTTWQMTKTVSLGVEYQHTEVKASETKPWVNADGTFTDKNKFDMFRFKLKATLW